MKLACDSVTPLFRHRLSEILVFILTLIAACRRMSSGLSQVALLCSIRWDLSSSVYQSMVVALVLSRLDYGNVTLAGLPTCLLNRLQSVLNAAAWSIASLCRSEHITDALASFHWLRASKRIKFKLAVTVYRALHGTAPQYLSDRLQYIAICRRDVEADCDCRPPVSLMSAIQGICFGSHTQRLSFSCLAI